MSYSFALQKAVRAQLLADPGVAALIVDRVYDRPYQNAVYPYARFGPSDVVRPSDDDCVQGRFESLQIDTFSHDPSGLEETKRILDAITAAIDGADLVLEAGALIEIEVTRALARYDADGITGRGIITIEAAIEE